MKAEGGEMKRPAGFEKQFFHPSSFQIAIDSITPIQWSALS